MINNLNVNNARIENILFLHFFRPHIGIDKH